jgi:hypothetical protein
LVKNGDFTKFIVKNKQFMVTYYERPHMSVRRFQKEYQLGIYVIRVGGHIFCMKDGVIFNQSNYNAKISYYFKITRL